MLDDKAKDLLENSRLYVKVITGRLRHDYPDIFSDVNTIERFEFFCTIAQVVLTCIRLHFEVDENIRTPLEMIVRDCIEDWYFEGLNAYEDVNQFISRHILSEPERKKRVLFMYEIVALWTIKRTLHELKEPPVELDDLLSSLSTLFVDGATGYWRSEV